MKVFPLLVVSLLATLCVGVSAHSCAHDEFVLNSTKHYYNDLSESRLLQQAETGRLRIFVDYSQVTVGSQTEINTIKRLVNITSSYFYHVLKVVRLPRLFFPSTQSKKCNTLDVPDKYVTEGTIGDVGVICGNQGNAAAVYVAKSAACAFLESNKRPIWGMISFNNAFLKYDQEGFQEIVFVGIHEMTHILGFSSGMFSTYPAGNPLVQDNATGYSYFNSSAIQREIKSYFNCTQSMGLPLEDQDGTLVASHWQKKVLGNQFMIASNKKASYVSRFSLALLESTGWYPQVNYTYAEPSTWGANKGCSFLNIDNCNSQQFCNDDEFSCDWDGTGIGRCSIDSFTGICKIPKYFTNTICVDENFELKNLNSKLNSFERGGSNSRCFKSDFRQDGTTPTVLNNRCYYSICSSSGRFIYLLVGSYILVCGSQGQIVKAPPGLVGTLTCPKNFGNYCQSKKTCPYHCNKNGACINGQCLCTGQTSISGNCMDVSIFLAPIGISGGLLGSISDTNEQLPTDLQNNNSTSTKRNTLKHYSINSKCIQGSAFDPFFGECLKCSEVFNCIDCNDSGCISCDDGTVPDANKRC